MTTKTQDNQAEPTFFGTDDDQTVLRYTYTCRDEAYTAKRDRMLMNRMNFDTYNLKGDWTHKKKGQSQEFLPRQMMAVEQIASFIHQAIVDSGDWFRVEVEPGIKDPKITAEEIRLLMKRQFRKIDFSAIIDDLVKLGLLGSLCVTKVHGAYVDKPRFYTRLPQPNGGERPRPELWKSVQKVWELRVENIRQEDWYPDPTGDKLFEIQAIEQDLFQIKKKSMGPHAIYDKDIVDQIVGGFEDVEQVGKRARESAQNQTFHNLRKRVRLWECYGSILDPTTGDLLYENVTWTVCNDRYLIRKPVPYPFWHGRKPIVAVPLIRQGQPQSVWHKALMDAPTLLNSALNELFNLQLDTGLMATFGIRQLHTDWLSDESQIDDGIGPGMTLEVNSNCPPGGKALEPVQTAVMTPETMSTYQTLSGEFQQSAMTNDLRMGVMPQRDVKATEVVEASDTMTSMFTGMSKGFEESGLVPILELVWATIAQHLNDLDSDEVKALIGEDRAMALAALTNEELFAATAQGVKFHAYGISQNLAKQKDFKKIMALMQTVGGSPQMMEEYIKQYSMGALLTEFMRTLDINTAKLEIPPEEKAAMAAQGGSPQMGGPNMQSQIPQATTPGPSQAGGPQPGAVNNFPPSRALQARGV